MERIRLDHEVRGPYCLPPTRSTISPFPPHGSILGWEGGEEGKGAYY